MITREIIISKRYIKKRERDYIPIYKERYAELIDRNNIHVALRYILRLNLMICSRNLCAKIGDNIFIAFTIKRPAHKPDKLIFSGCILVN